MYFIRNTFIVFMLGLSIYHSARAAAITTYGSYLGKLTHESLNKEQLVKLELIPAREDGGNISLRGILTLQFGGFDSGEYISYHFHDIGFNILTGVLTFNQTDQDVYLKDANIKDGIFRGELYSTSGRVGPISLSKHNELKLVSPLLEPLNGEYRGKCGKEQGSLQLYTYRSINDSSRLGNSFGAYEVKGQLGSPKPNQAGTEKNKYFTQSKIKSASYDFFNGNLILNGHPYNYSCKVDGSKIKCGECQFQRVSDEMLKPRLQFAPVVKEPFADLKLLSVDNKDSKLSGQYNGYLYHENLNSYQRVQIDLTTYQQTTSDGSSLIVSAIAKISFGKSTNEVLVYRFDPVEYPNPLLKPQFVLARAEADVDAIVQVTDIKGGILRGNWHSTIFGKVGTFIATKNEELPEMSNYEFLEQVSSTYQEWGEHSKKDLILELLVNKDRAPLNSDNPFYPLSIKGWIWRKSGIIPKETVLESSYDFYTGRVALLYGDQYILNGQLNLNKQTKLRRLGGGFGTIMQNFELVDFKQTKGN